MKIKPFSNWLAEAESGDAGDPWNPYATDREYGQWLDGVRAQLLTRDQNLMWAYAFGAWKGGPNGTKPVEHFHVGVKFKEETRDSASSKHGGEAANPKEVPEIGIRSGGGAVGDHLVFGLKQGKIYYEKKWRPDPDPIPLNSTFQQFKAWFDKANSSFF